MEKRRNKKSLYDAYKFPGFTDPDPKILMSKLSTELPTTGACLAGVFEYPPYAPIMDNSPWHFMLPPEA